ncbi:hypothetical protein [Streptomyces sp. ITFR-16]|uniref:hypothetical protein n=1 Tax=Streptomyces sp. ITFR-16 TaxID=3075198 RepID=UPI0028894F32|nr:hypothetical protein [Streptomyces sp. ITFR-16]WNI23372.1 hypothetical protein RLT58_16185 [Streptomyces sp. ITFR-16]
MPFVALGIEQLVQWKYGLMGAVGFTLLSFGLKAGSHNCVCAGALILALLLVPGDD